MDRPNILFFCTDQHRRDMLSVYGNPIVRTPAADRLAREGVVFDHSYTPSAICTPTRATLLTGVLPFKHKLLANFERNVGYITELPDDTVTFAHLLSAAGYRVGHVGKWHVGQLKGPSDFGLEGEHYPGWGPPTEHPDYLRYLDERGLPHFSVRDEVRGTFPNGRPGNPIMGVYQGPVEGTFDYFIAERSIERLRDYARGYHERGQPFYLNCHWFGPHLPYFIPEAYLTMYDPATVPLPASVAETFEHKPMVQRHYSAHWTFDSFDEAMWRRLIAAKWGYGTLIDEQLGRVLAEVDRLGLADNTLVVFTCDHGAFTGAHRMQDKGPAMYDDIYRIHLLARLPAALPGPQTSGGPGNPGGTQGRREERFVSLVDLPATWLDAAGIPVPQEFDGCSLLPLLRGEAPSEWRRDVVCEFHGHHFPYPQRMIRTARHKLVVNPPDVNELYDFQVDPHELTNRIDDPAYAVVRRDLMRRLYRQLRERGDNFYHWMTTMFEVDSPEDGDASLSGFGPRR
jgi:arylsulfatase A-like enzyme